MSEKKSRCEMIRSDIAALEGKLAANQADVERVDRHKAKLQGQQDSLVERFRDDLKARAELETLEEQEGKLDREKRRYLKEADRLQARIAKLTEGLNFAVAMEAAESCLATCPLELALARSLKAHVDGLVKDSLALLAAGEKNMAYALAAGIKTTDVRPINSEWDLLNYLQSERGLYPLLARLHKRLASEDPVLPNKDEESGSFNRSLEELLCVSHAKRKMLLDKVLRAGQGSEEKPNLQEVA